MGGYTWTEEEIAVTVYFASQGVQHEVIAKILAQRGFTLRTKVGVKDKLIETHKKHPELKSSRHWNSEKVDNWLDGLLEHLNAAILEPTDEDERLVNEVRPSSIEKGIHALT